MRGVELALYRRLRSIRTVWSRSIRTRARTPGPAWLAALGRDPVSAVPPVWRGQQGPLFASPGYRLTVADICREQLQKDVEVARAFGIEIECVETDMLDFRFFIAVVSTGCTRMFPRVMFR